MEGTKGDRGTAFLVECFAPRSEGIAETRVGEACAELRSAGVEVTYLGALLVSDDELAFHVFSADDAGSVVAVCRRASLRVERVVPAVVIGFDMRRRAAGRALPISVEAERSIAHAPRKIGP
jgi:hypothetical protein